jgi:anti-sigma B factor antagonist
MQGTGVKIEIIEDITMIRVQEAKIYQKVANEFRSHMLSILDEDRLKIIVDLSQVEVMNSSGLGVLISMWDYLSKQGGHLVIMGLGTLMNELFERMRLNTIFLVAGSEEEAIQMVNMQ